MSELRWTLLILGVVFIAALSWWERRRPRQAFAPRLREMGVSHGDAQRASSPEPLIGAEPWIGEAGLSDVVSSDVTLTDAADEPRAETSMHARLESAPGPLEDLPTLLIPDAEECRALEAAWTAQPPEPRLIDPQTPDTPPPALTASAAMEPPAASGPMSASEPVAGVAANEPAGATEPIPAQDADPVRVPLAVTPAHSEIPGAEGVGAVRIVESPYGNGEAPVEPIVEWPPEESRRIIALRLIAPQPARFPGRTLRLALAAEGFLLGKFSIFHKPDETNRAVLSAASLTRPGAFDLETMDSQRYAGLSLFAVLPGVMAPAQAFEELLATARNLNERLEGALQDERGGPLTPLRVASIRETLRAEAATLPAAAHGA